MIDNNYFRKQPLDLIVLVSKSGWEGNGRHFLISQQSAIPGQGHIELVGMSDLGGYCPINFNTVLRFLTILACQPNQPKGIAASVTNTNSVRRLN